MNQVLHKSMKEDYVIKRLNNTIEQLQSEVFRLKSVIEQLPGSIYWKDKNGIYLGRNAYSMKKMQNLDLEKNKAQDAIIGKTDYDIFPKDVADRYRQHDLEVMATKKEVALEEPITLPNGKTAIQLSTKMPLYNEKGEVDGVVGNTVDITYLKDIENELQREKVKAEQANHIKTEFIRNMEHDIRTPFNGVWGMANYLWEQETDENKKEYLGDITQCAKELLDYCNSILDFSKIESGMLAVMDKKFDLEKLIDSIIKIELPAAKHRKLQLKKSYDTKIPPVLVGDHHRLYRILINLVSNALKFTAKGYVELKTLVVKMKNDTVLIRFIIEDTGMGIPADKQEYIFEKFSRLSLSNKGVYKGIGLGLRVVKQFMHDINGEIDLISEVKKGTQFICTVPFKLPLTNDFVEQ